MKVAKQVSIESDAESFGQTPRKAIAESHDGFGFSFLRILYSGFQSSRTNLQFHRQQMKVLFSSHPLQHWLSAVLLNFGILTGVRQIFKVVISISPARDD